MDPTTPQADPRFNNKANKLLVTREQVELWTETAKIVKGIRGAGKITAKHSNNGIVIFDSNGQASVDEDDILRGTSAIRQIPKVDEYGDSVKDANGNPVKDLINIGEHPTVEYSPRNLNDSKIIDATGDPINLDKNADGSAWDPEDLGDALPGIMEYVVFNENTGLLPLGGGYYAAHSYGKGPIKLYKEGIVNGTMKYRSINFTDTVDTFNVTWDGTGTPPVSDYGVWAKQEFTADPETLPIAFSLRYWSGIQPVPEGGSIAPDPTSYNSADWAYQLNFKRISETTLHYDMIKAYPTIAMSYTPILQFRNPVGYISFAVLDTDTNTVEIPTGYTEIIGVYETSIYTDRYKFNIDTPFDVPTNFVDTQKITFTLNNEEYTGMYVDYAVEHIAATRPLAVAIVNGTTLQTGLTGEYSGSRQVSYVISDNLDNGVPLAFSNNSDLGSTPVLDLQIQYRQRGVEDVSFNANVKFTLDSIEVSKITVKGYNIKEDALKTYYKLNVGDDLGLTQVNTEEPYTDKGTIITDILNYGTEDLITYELNLTGEFDLYSFLINKHPEATGTPLSVTLHDQERYNVGNYFTAAYRGNQATTPAEGVYQYFIKIEENDWGRTVITNNACTFINMYYVRFVNTPGLTYGKVGAYVTGRKNKATSITQVDTLTVNNLDTDDIEGDPISLTYINATFTEENGKYTPWLPVFTQAPNVSIYIERPKYV